MAVSKITQNSMDSSAIHGRRNMIINGAMEVYQRNTSVASVSDNTYVVQDRMNFFSSNDGVITVTADSTHPTGAGFSKSLKVDVTTADTSIAAGQYLAINQRIEGLNHRILEYGTASAKSIVVSFYAKSNLTGPFCYSVKNNASDRSFPVEFSLSAANTWERISFTIPGDTSGTWLETTGNGAYHQIALAMGSTYHGTNNTWQAGNKVATSNQVNLLSSTSNEFFLTGWQVEIGSGAPTAFEHEDYGTTLAKCQRYYYRIASDQYAFFATGKVLANIPIVPITFPTAMRLTPSMTASNTASWYNNVGNIVAISTPTVHYSSGESNITTLDVRFADNSTVNGNTEPQGFAFNPAGYLDFSAEL